MTGFEYVSELNDQIQNVIRNAVSEVVDDPESVEIAMNSRLIDLEDCIDWREIIKIFL